MKVKNVIKGLLQKYALEEITIIDADTIIFSGTIQQWKATDVDLILYKREIENREVIHRMMFNGRKAFIFIGNPFTDAGCACRKGGYQHTHLAGL